MTCQVSYSAGSSDGAQSVVLASGLVMEWAVDGDVVRFTVTLSHDSWLGIGFGRSPGMIKPHSVIAKPGDGTVKEYTITQKDVAGITLQSSQDLTATSVGTVDGSTVVRFTRKKVSSDRNDVDIGDFNTRVSYAYGGPGSSFGYHDNMRGEVTVNFVTGESSAVGVETIRVVHGVLMYLA